MLSMGLAEHACTSMALAELGRRCDGFLFSFSRRKIHPLKEKTKAQGRALWH